MTEYRIASDCAAVVFPTFNAAEAFGLACIAHGIAPDIHASDGVTYSFDPLHGVYRCAEDIERDGDDWRDAYYAREAAEHEEEILTLDDDYFDGDSEDMVAYLSY